jgi:hypothetical protein
MWEMKIIQEEFMRHFGAARPEDLKVPDGDYLVPVYDMYFNVRVYEGRYMALIPPEDFDESKATRIGDCH